MARYRTLLTIRRDDAPEVCVKIGRSAEWQEYRARIYRAGEPRPEADYFTGDRLDAIASGEAMLRFELDGRA